MAYIGKEHLQIRKKEPRIFPINELDGFYIDKKLNRCVHITFESEKTVIIDIYDTPEAAHKPVGNILGIIEVNIKTGEAKFYKEGR